MKISRVFRVFYVMIDEDFRAKTVYRRRRQIDILLYNCVTIEIFFFLTSTRNRTYWGKISRKIKMDQEQKKKRRKYFIG